MSIHVKEHHDQIRKMAEEAFGGHEITYEGGGDAVRSWLCRRPDRGMHWFRVILGPNMIMVTGDLGDMVLHPHTPDVMAWVKGSLRSVSYVFEKLGHKLVEFDAELVKSGLDEYERDLRDGLDEGEDLGQEMKDAFEDLRQREFYTAQSFYDAFYDSPLYADYESMPCVERYSDSFYWRLEALRWFAQHVRE